MIILLCYVLCSVYVSVINGPDGGHFETHIPGSEYLEGIGCTHQKLRVNEHKVEMIS